MIRFLATLILLLCANMAAACSCSPRPDAGFIHATVKRLPANARGALFLIPGDSIKPEAFLITSDKEPGPLKAAITWPQLSERETNRFLARVAPAAGFKPGAHYTIRYKGGSKAWRYPFQTDFFIDSEALDTAKANYQLVLDGPPTRQLLLQSTHSGSCSSQQPAAVQEFHYTVPDDYAPYSDALFYYSDETPAAEPYFAALCENDSFGVTALGGNHDMVHSSCAAPKGKLAIKSWIGLLEVEDRVRPTNIIHTDLGAASGTACTEFGILKEALASGDSRRMKNAACHISGTEIYAWSPTPPKDLPSPADMMQLVESRFIPRICTQLAIGALLAHSGPEGTQLAAAMGQMIREDLSSSDSKTVDEALLILGSQTSSILHDTKEHHLMHVQAMIRPSLPILKTMLESGRADPQPVYRPDLGFISSPLPIAIMIDIALTQPISQALDRWDHDEHPDLRSVLVVRHRDIIAERYYNGATEESLHDIRSAGKSITALLVGAARLNPHAPINRYWPAVKNTALDGVTLEQVLTMRSGLAAFDADPASPGNEDKMDDASDPVAFTLSTPAASKPGTAYRYNSMTAYVAGLAVEQATGKDLEDFARTALFQPLGIDHWEWGRDAAHHPKGQGNLSLRTRDMAKIGEIVLRGGSYYDETVVDSKWIEAMLAPHVVIGDTDRYADHYGYFWYQKTYRIGERDILVHFASGNGGNKIYVVPEWNAVVVITSSAYGKSYGQQRSENILKAVLASITYTPVAP